MDYNIFIFFIYFFLGGGGGACVYIIHIGEPSVYCLIGRTLYTEFDIGENSGRAQSLRDVQAAKKRRKKRKKKKLCGVEGVMLELTWPICL